MSKCDNCINSRPIISENGWHGICTLSHKEEANCMTGKKDRFFRWPPIKNEAKGDFEMPEGKSLRF